MSDEPCPLDTKGSAVSNSNKYKYGNSVKPKVCPFWARGSCEKGTDCKYAHYVPSEREKQKRSREDDRDHPYVKRAPGVCPYFASGRCTYGSTCKYLHSGYPQVLQICPYFPLGRCTKGTECRMLHQLSTQSPTVNLASDNTTALLTSVLQQLTNPLTPESISTLASLVSQSQHQVPQQYNNSSHGGGKRGQTQICKHHQLGTCTWGAECRFSHGGQSTTICPYYPLGRCARGDECRMIHEGNIPQDRVPHHLSTNVQLPEIQMPLPESDRPSEEEVGEAIPFPDMSRQPEPAYPEETVDEPEQNEQVVDFNQNFQQDTSSFTI